MTHFLLKASSLWPQEVGTIDSWYMAFDIGQQVSFDM